MSNCKAEYIAAATTSCQIVWLGRLLAEILNKELREGMLRVDNKSAISLIRNLLLNDGSRHIDTRYHLTRDYEASGQIKVQFIRTDEQLGNIFTNR
jgi:hypothetical protein